MPAEAAPLYDRLQSLENVLLAWHEEKEKDQKQKEHRFRRFLVQLVIIAATAVGVVWSMLEMGAWYWDRWQKRTMAERYNAVANSMYEEENSPDVALQMLEQSLALDDCFETRYQYAYIKGMKAVQLLLNLDRPFTSDELNTAHLSLAEAKFLIQLSPDRPEGYILESQIYTALGEYDNAEKSIQRALEIVPDHAFAQIRYTTLLFNQQKYQEAQKIVEKVLAANPDYKWGYLWYGLVLDAQKKKKDAIIQLEKAIELDPKFDTAIYNLGLSHLNSRPRNYAGARKYFLQVLKINPSYKQAYYQLGMSYGFEDRYDVALTYMDKALAVSKDYLTAHQWKALVLFEMKRYDEAIVSYSEAIMLDPRNDELYVSRARVKYNLQQLNDAICDLDFALELNPQNSEALMIRSEIHAKNGNITAALADIDEAMKISKGKGTLADLWSTRAKIQYSAGKTAEAIADQKKAVACYRSKHTLCNLAWYQANAGLTADALKTLDDLHKLDGKFAKAWKLRAKLLKNQDKAAALAAVDKCLAVTPEDKEMQKLKKELLAK